MGFGIYLKRAMERIYNKIRRSNINDLEIIQDVESAKEILGFDINLGDEVNWSLLMNAVDYGREELVKYLLSFPGVNVNHRNNYGYTALHVCKNVSVLKLLFSCRDLDVNIQNKWGEMGLHWNRETRVNTYS